MDKPSNQLIKSEIKNNNTHGIFISYRREGGGIFAGILYDGLCRYLTAEKIFKDVHSLAPGSDFVETISNAIQSSDILVVVIDKYWIKEKNEQSELKIFQKEDFVHFEIREAIRNDLTIIPVLIDGAKMPVEMDLPKDIAEFSRYHALIIQHESISEDLQKLINLLREQTEKYCDQTIIGSTVKLFNNPVGALTDAINKTASIYKKDYEYVKDFLVDKSSKSNFFKKFFKKK